MSKYVTLSYLRAQAGELANRDDTGSAKTLIYGGVSRTRISSQSIKQRLRTSTSQYALEYDGVQDGIRSKLIFAKIAEHAIEMDVPKADAIRAAGWLKSVVIRVAKEKTQAPAPTSDGSAPAATGRGKKPPKNASPEGASGAPSMDDLRTEQLIFLGHPEIAYMVAQIVEAWRKCDHNSDTLLAKLEETFNLSDKKNSLAAISASSGITTAMFGRFITSEAIARTDAAIHVAHAFTVHKQETVDDYFTAVDDLSPDGEGAGHLDNTELTSGLFLYSIVVDVDLLVKNLSGDARVAAEVVRRLVMLAATQSVSAKKGSTAPHSRAQLVMVECDDAQPRTLAGCFETPVRSNGGWLQPAMKQLADYLGRENDMYGISGTRCYATLSDETLPGTREKSALDVAACAAKAVLDGRDD